MTTRTLGRSGIEVGAIGMGCWAIGGPFWSPEGEPFGWGAVDDAESIRTVHRAIDLGVTLFDTASNYGAGHSERVLGRAVTGRRERVVIASKFGHTFDESRQLATGVDSSVGYLVSCLDGILDRLGTDYLDLYQLHLNDLPLHTALAMVDTLEHEVDRGRIRAYGWSTDDPVNAAAFADAAPHCTAIQHDQSVLHDNTAMITVCESRGLASLARGPLAMGLLTGKYHGNRAALGGDDVRTLAPEWLPWFDAGRPVPAWAERVDQLRQQLTADGRTLAQGALGWLLARSPVIIPIPGARTEAQAEENFATLKLAPM
jgi:aryl-alcohol dehydrogenase-like predicted oxidoreductase